MTKDEESFLEGLIDKHGLSAVLYAVATLCMEKAEHLEGNWQDKPSALCWEQDALSVERAAQEVVVS